MAGTAADVLARADELGAISEEPDRLVRRFGTPALARASDRVAGWMEEAGLTVRRDAVGNLIGRAAGDAPPFVLGSHLDTVPNAGRYDGPLGILVALAAVERLSARGAAPIPLEVVAFADEEGTRFGTSYLGSAAYTGGFEREWLGLVDADGITLGEAIAATGENPDSAAEPPPPQLAGYLEVHIEQGPVLEREDLPVGVVSAVAGQTRPRVVVTGAAGHAGTLPMNGRRDALAAAAEIVLAVERIGRGTDGLVATVGAMELSPNVANVVPGEARLLLDVRHAEDDARARATDAMRAEVERIASERGVDVTWTLRYDTPAVELSPDLRRRLEGAVEEAGHPVRTLVSGAGHDAVMLARVCPAAMLFVRCAGGISHDPREAVEEADVAVALDVVERFLRGL
ncbi:MAG TPA: allantoate amidohydrolase [Gaiella sp.]|nr:allantoate amidohydrolase [Gaiella sp.]